jgi:hypothetical protein
MQGLGIGDVRTAARGAWFFDRIVATGSVVVRRLGEGRAEEIAAHRYLSSPYVTPAGILDASSGRTARACSGRRIVAAQDTTEINFAGRGAARRGLGPGSDGKSPGFFIHPVIAVDAEDEAVIGVVHAQIWTRAGEPVGSRRSRSVADKESGRWIAGTRAAGERLAAARSIVVVADREGDIYSHFAARPPGVDLAVRARHNRALEDGGSLFEAATRWPDLKSTEVRVAPRGPGDKGRTAQVVLRAGTVRIAKPATAERHDPKTLALGLVEVREPAPPPGVTALLWRIVTTLPTDTAAAAAEVVRLYRLRWRIEEVFRAMKADGLRLEDTQVLDAERLFRLSALALGAAVRIIQLVDARDGSSRPMTDVLDGNLLDAVIVIGKTREGKTARQKNSHPLGSLAWLAWIVARHGGWNCYYKPPGPKTMAIGWERFAATLAGFILAQAEALV